MKITLRTVQGKTFQLDLDPSTKASDLVITFQWISKIGSSDLQPNLIFNHLTFIWYITLPTFLQIGDVKAAIEAEQGADFPKDATNIIYQGKILKDDETVAESNYIESGFCVIMAMKVRLRSTTK